MFHNIVRQDIGYFDAPDHATGELVSKLSSGPQDLMDLLGFNIGLMIINVVNIIASSALAFAVGWRLSLAIVLGALPVLVFCGYLRIRLESKLAAATEERFAIGTSYATEAIAAIRTVASLTLERHIVEKFEEKVSGVARQSMRALLWTMFWYGIAQSSSFLAMALGFWYCSNVSTGKAMFSHQWQVWWSTDGKWRIHCQSILHRFRCCYILRGKYETCQIQWRVLTIVL